MIGLKNISAGELSRGMSDRDKLLVEMIDTAFPLPIEFHDDYKRLIENDVSLTEYAPLGKSTVRIYSRKKGLE
jgi:hypothetical protein